MDKVIEDLQWFYKTLDTGGKTAEFYEAQKNIILQTLVVLEKQIPQKWQYEEERTSVNNYIKSISHELITLDVEEIENVLNIRDDGKYFKFTDKYLITVTRR